jgi:hypothetical protein
MYRTFIYYIYDLIGPVRADDVAFTIVALINLVKQLPASFIYLHKFCIIEFNFVLFDWESMRRNRKATSRSLAFCDLIMCHPLSAQYISKLQWAALINILPDILYISNKL